MDIISLVLRWIELIVRMIQGLYDSLPSSFEDLLDIIKQFVAHIWDLTVNVDNTDSLIAFVPYIIGVILILFVVQLFELPFQLVWNGLVGAAMLWLINLVGGFVGFGLKITVIKALIAGFFGIPGALAIVLFEIFG